MLLPSQARTEARGIPDVDHFSETKLPNRVFHDSACGNHCEITATRTMQQHPTRVGEIFVGTHHAIGSCKKEQQNDNGKETNEEENTEVAGPERFLQPWTQRRCHTAADEYDNA